MYYTYELMSKYGLYKIIKLCRSYDLVKSILSLILRCISIDTARPDINQELQQPNPDLDKLEVEYIAKFGSLGKTINQDIHKFINFFCVNMRKNVDNKSIDDVADYAQNFYNKFTKRMDSNHDYEQIPPEIREQLLDFLEKFSMTCLYRLVNSHFICVYLT